MLFTLGCKFTWEYFLIGCAGGLVATLILPGCYLSMPQYRLEGGDKRVYAGFVARLIVAGIIGCVVDCNQRNVFFGGFFSWHACRWLADDGWKWLEAKLKNVICK